MRQPICHVVNVRAMPRAGRSEAFEADEQARLALRDHLGIRDVRSFSASADITAWRGDGVKVEGRVSADLVQDCIVTLEPIETQVDETFEAVFVPEGSRLDNPAMGDVQMMVDAEGDDPPETFPGDALDLGPVWTEFLTLAVDPFPRKPGAELPSAEGETEPSPFAALAKLKAANGNQP